MTLYKTSSDSGTLPPSVQYDQVIILSLGRQGELTRAIDQARAQSMTTVVIPLNERLNGFHDVLSWKHLTLSEQYAFRKITHLSQLCILGFSKPGNMQIWGSFLEGVHLIWIEHITSLIEEAPALKGASLRTFEIKLIVEELDDTFGETLCQDLWNRQIRAQVTKDSNNFFIDSNGNMRAGSMDLKVSLFR